MVKATSVHLGTRSVRASGMLLVAVAVAMGVGTPALAAAPRLLMISGEPLAGPILLSDANEVFEVYGSFFRGKAADHASLEGRPFLRLGLFWDNRLWEPYVRERRLGELRLSQANQVGRFYPAVGAKPALVDVPGYGQWPKLVDKQALRILERRGVPVRLDSGAGVSASWIAAGSAALAIAAMGAVGLRRRGAQ